MIQAPLPQFVLKVNLMVDIEFSKTDGTEVTVHEEGQVSANKVDS